MTNQKSQGYLSLSIYLAAMAEPSTSPTQTTTTTTTTPSPWGTREDFMLACAVHRYGTDAWDSISRELQNRTAFSVFTPNVCQQKYRELKRRFASDAGEITVDDAGLCLDELRRLRVAELRRDLQRYDLSIVSLQLKVKKLNEEREINNMKEEIKEEREEKSDLQKNERETEINEVKIEPPGGNEPEPVELEGNELDRVNEPVRGEEDDSCNGSSNSKEEGKGDQERRERVDSAELVESVAESKDDGGSGGGRGEREEGVKESSDVQSTASLWRSENNNNDINNNKNNNIRREKKAGVFSGTSSGEENQSPALKSNNDGKSQPLVEFLDIVRARKLGSFFERRLESQETLKYTSLIKQHIDLETIQRRLEEGQYTDCQTKFYRDLMLLINNAIVFFTRRSSEHKAALELRQLLNKQFQSHLSCPHDHKSRPSKPAQPAPLPKPKKPEANQADLKEPPLIIKVPVNACRKRSSIAGNSSRGGSEKKEPALVTPPDEKAASLGEMIKQQREKTASTSFNAVTKKRTRDQSFGSRSSSSKNNNSNRSPNTPISSKGESFEAKADKKKSSPGSSSNKIKHVSGSGKDLLLQSLKNSDKRKTSSGNGSSSGNVKSDGRKDEGSLNGSGSKLGKEKTKVKEEREGPGNRSNRRLPKRATAIAAMGKRGRDGGGEAESQSKKRQRK